MPCTPTCTLIFGYVLALASTALACSTVRVIGFSLYTCLPASIASIVTCECQCSGVAFRM